MMNYALASLETFIFYRIIPPMVPSSFASLVQWRLFWEMWYAVHRLPIQLKLPNCRKGFLMSCFIQFSVLFIHMFSTSPRDVDCLRVS